MCSMGLYMETTITDTPSPSALFPSSHTNSRNSFMREKTKLKQQKCLLYFHVSKTASCVTSPMWVSLPSFSSLTWSYTCAFSSPLKPSISLSLSLVYQYDITRQVYMPCIAAHLSSWIFIALLVSLSSSMLSS